MTTTDLVEFFQTRRACSFPVAERLADAVVIRRKHTPNMHPNSIAAYSVEGETFGQRAQQVIAKLRAIGRATDKQVAFALGYSHKAAVQPRISELVSAGIIEECGSERDPDTGKTVRVVRVRPAGEQQTILDGI